MRITNQMLTNQLKKMVGKSSGNKSSEQPLKIGSEFTAKIANVFNNSLTLEIGHGKYVEAFDTSGANYEEGELVEFAVTDQDADGRISIKALVPESSEVLEIKELQNIMSKTSFPSTPENLEVVKELMLNKIPVTDENIKLIINTKAYFDKALLLTKDNSLQLTDEKLNQAIKSVLVDNIKNELTLGNKLELEAGNYKDTNELGNSTILEEKGSVKQGEVVNSEKNMDVEKNTIPVTLKETNETTEDLSKGVIKNQNEEESVTKEKIFKKVDNNMFKNRDVQKLDDSISEDKPLSKAAIKELSSIVKQLNPEKLVFLMKNQMEFTMNNVKGMENLIIGKDKLAKQIDDMITKIESKHPESEVVKVLRNAMKGLALEDLSNKQKVEAGLKSISEALEKASTSKIIENSSEGIKSQLGEVKNSVDFLNQLNNQMTFLQIPVQMNNNSNNIDIFIQRDNSGKRKINPNDTKVFISLDTKYLEKVQVLIEIKEKNINLNFRIDNDQVKKILKENDSLLLPSMSAMGFNQVNMNYAITEEKMDLTNMVRLNSEDTINKIDMKV